MATATKSALERLHEKIAAAYEKEIDRYLAGEVLDGNENPKPVPSSLLTSAAKFLNDNAVDRPLDDTVVTDDSLNGLPVFDDEKVKP